MRNRMMSLMILTVFFVFSAAAIAETKKQAKISMKEARAIALKRVPGKIKSAELENEGGLVYSFDIKTSKSGVEEVLVSAIDGKIVKVEHETAAKEAAEKKQEAKEKSAPKKP